MRAEPAPWWKRRPARIATLCAVTALAWAGIAAGLRQDAPLGPDRSTYEGQGGTARWEGAALVLPELAAEPAGAAAPDAVLRLRGRSRAEATALLGPPSSTPTAGFLLWESALRLAHPEPGQWPVAHVALRLGADGRVAAVALLGSLGRVLESDPGEPGYESGRADPARRKDTP